MDDLLRLPPEERQIYFQQAAANLGFSPAIVEKDFWVCRTLRALFSMPDWKEHLLFKGGTSLSKGYRLIKRFSEDIDIVISREKLGFAGDHSLSSNQLKKLRKACQKAVGDGVRKALLHSIETSPCSETLSLKIDESDPDESTLLMQFNTGATSMESYLRPAVKIEIGARSDTWPSDEISIHPMVSEALPDAVNESGVRVRVLSPRRTFWEKAMLLHEENYRPSDKKRKARMARHYYDLWCLIRAGIAKEAAEDPELFESVADHRRVFFRQKWVDYKTLKRGTLRILPKPETEPEWREDYKAMNSFFFPDEQPPDWSQIIESVGSFEREFNTPQN